MTIGLISFSDRGYSLEKRLLEEFQKDRVDEEEMIEMIPAVKCEFLKEFEEQGRIVKVENVRKWVEQTLQKTDAYIFIGACGIAVRCMAEFIRDKKTDPAVIVIDECGKYCIPILSGHLGGANALSERISGYLLAENIITTATDLNQVFAVDVFAKKNQLYIADMQLAKKISAAFLAGREVLFHCEGRICGSLPMGLKPASKGTGLGICVALKEEGDPPFTETLYLNPQALVLGIGCRKNTALEKIQAAVWEVMEQNHVTMNTVKCIASIDLKKEEKGMIDFCQQHKKPFLTYTSEELQETKGRFQASVFVESVTGADNVCERSAVKACGEKSILLQQKYVKGGVTVAIAVSDWRVSFD